MIYSQGSGILDSPMIFWAPEGLSIPTFLSHGLEPTPLHTCCCPWQTGHSAISNMLELLLELCTLTISLPRHLFRDSDLATHAGSQPLLHDSSILYLSCLQNQYHMKNSYCQVLLLHADPEETHSYSQNISSVMPISYHYS